jgi:hypothetical protein
MRATASGLSTATCEHAGKFGKPKNKSGHGRMLLPGAYVSDRHSVRNSTSPQYPAHANRSAFVPIAAGRLTSLPHTTFAVDDHYPLNNDHDAPEFETLELNDRPRY